MLGLFAGAAYVEGPPAAHTGGFGEPTCQECHFGADLNAPGGVLRLEGLPTTYLPDQSYPLTITMHKPGIAAGGFQLSARFEDGTQAGVVQSIDITTQISRSATDIQYIYHSYLGTTPTASDTVHWEILWQAPPDTSRTVLFHVVANAGNGDNSPFDDYIYQDSILTQGANTP